MKLSKAEIKRYRALKEKKFRDQEGLFIAEGAKCVEELQKGFELVQLIDGSNATPTELEQLSSLRTPQGVIGIFRQREANIAKPISRSQYREANITQLTLALDGIQDPGNLGTIIRTADWFGVRLIVASRETADCYNPKVVQATMGALARVRIIYKEDLRAWIEAQHCPVIGTLLEGKDMYTTPLPRDGQVILVMGNEGNGITDEVRQCITHAIKIPSYPKDAETSESLNVAIATAIMLHELRRP